jgi:pimeloyl-ACP methyl ester carboxylesterase
MDARPGSPVHLIGLSAGTVVLVYTLEALPKNYQVQTAILIGSSVRADYDLTQALHRVRGRMYVFASKYDPLLNSLVPAVGTADRSFTGRSVAGLEGFVLPSGAGKETRAQYAKVGNVHWRPEFARYGHAGSHTGATSREFVRHYIAPLLRRPATPPATRPAPPPPAITARPR